MNEQTTEIVPATPETEIAEQTPATLPAYRKLNFTVVRGYLRGDHRKPFELHATGCRDLKRAQREGMWSYEFLADDQAAAIAASGDEHGAHSVHCQPCTLLKRMQAIGRA